MSLEEHGAPPAAILHSVFMGWIIKQAAQPELLWETSSLVLKFELCK